MHSSINLEPAQPYIQAEALPDLVVRYLAEASLRVSPQTAKGYDYQLSLLLEWWALAEDALDHRLGPGAWTLFAEWLTRRPTKQGTLTAPGTQRRVLSTCRQMLAWAHTHGYLDRDFSGQVPQVKTRPSRRAAPSEDDLTRLMQAAGESGKPVRDMALIALFIGTGIRRAEAVAVDVEHLQWLADGSGLLRVVSGKGGKPRQVAFDHVCGTYLDALVDELARSAGPLFVGWHGERLVPVSAYRVVKGAMKRAGIDNRGAGPHDLRRAFATAWLRHRRSLGDGQLLAMQLGHTTEAMSVYYSRQTLDDLVDGFTSPMLGIGGIEKGRPPLSESESDNRPDRLENI